MKIKEKILEFYEAPIIEIVTFTISDSIAISVDLGPGTLCGEEVKG